MLLLLITFHFWVSLLFLLLFPFSIWRNISASKMNLSPKDSQLGAWRESWTLDLNQVVWLQSPAFHPLPVVFVQLLSRVRLFATPWTAAHQTSLSFTVSWSLFQFMSIESVISSNHLILCRPLLLLPSVLPNMRISSSELALHIWWPKYWSFSFSFSPSNECLGFISLKIDWFDLLAVQGTIKRFLQPRNSKASILWHLASFMVQLSHPWPLEIP